MTINELNTFTNVGAYQITMPNSVIFGVGSLSMLPIEVSNRKSKRILIVSDHGVSKSGLVDLVKDQLRKTDATIEIFAESEQEPTFKTINSIAYELKNLKSDFLVGLGGGSCLDTAKGLSILLAYGGKAEDYVGTNNVPNPGIPMCLIPTTAGTGSEVTNIAIFSDADKETKLGIISSNILAKTAIIDPALTFGCPSNVSASSGIDALVHAIECYTSLKATNFTDALSLKAIELISSNIRTAVNDGSNQIARKMMSEGALLAGMAFSNASVAAVHALAYPLGAKFHVSHGVANGVLLPYVMESNIDCCAEKYRIIAQLLGVKTNSLSNVEATRLLIGVLKNLTNSIGIPSNLRSLGVSNESLEGLAIATMDISRLLANNPKKLNIDEVRKIWLNAW